MAMTQIQSKFEAIGIQRIGYIAMSISNLDNTSEPLIEEGSVIEIGGALHQAASDQDVDVNSDFAGIANSTKFYGYINGSTLIPALTTTAPTWSTDKQGWYDATEVHRYYMNAYKDGSGNWTGKSIIQSKMNTDLPSGSIVMYGGSVAPGGWLLCDGSAISRTAYSGLFGRIGTTFGVGDGSTTFNLPDFGGIFPRGAGTNTQLSDSSSTAFAATLGTYQDDAMQKITGSVSDFRGTGYVDVASGVFSLTDLGNQAVWAGGTATATSIDFDSNDSTSPNTARTDDAETRPANLAINFIIKV